MMQKFCSWVFHKVLGFTAEETVEKPQKYIVALAPHTSNWDFIVGIFYCYSIGTPCNFMMKKDWFFWPLGSLMRKLGGIPVDRSHKNHLTDQLAESAKSSDTFRLCITPEGTRKAQAEWKRGFYYIAQKADIPILLYGLDYERRLLSCTKMLRPTGDVDKDMVTIKLYFSQFRAKHPKQFVTGL